MYTPPITLTHSILSRCTEIAFLLGRLEGLDRPAPQPMLRRSTRLRTVHSSLAIEGNSLSLDQVTALFEGSRVLGPPRDVLEVQNALEVYEHLERWQPHAPSSMLEAHGLLLRGLSPDAGRWRSGNVGVIRGERVAHVAPPPGRVPGLMEALFDFAGQQGELHWLVRAAVFHYELEFIHPFSDGNGRMGRLWQQILLANHHPFFTLLSIETLIREHQQAYYDTLRACDRAGDSSAFVDLMLGLILRALEELAQRHRPAPSTRESRIQHACAALGDRSFSRKDYLALHRTISTATASRDLRWAVDRGLLTRTGERASTRYRRS